MTRSAASRSRVDAALEPLEEVLDDLPAGRHRQEVDRAVLVQAAGRCSQASAFSRVPRTAVARAKTSSIPALGCGRVRPRASIKALIRSRASGVSMLASSRSISAPMSSIATPILEIAELR